VFPVRFVSIYSSIKQYIQVQAFHSALSNNPLLHVYLLLDLNRSTRPGPSSTAHLLLPILRDFPDRVHISLFRSPKLSGMIGKLVPPRFNEGWGTWHAKIYGADDEVMISG
jgi:CDP-diacylglycerol---glycerol-3-phosphate 3-phosphatidyltransferase